MMKNNRIKIYQVIKYASVIILLIYVFSLFGGNHISNAEFTDVEAAVMAQMDTADMQKAENRMIKRLYGLTAGDYEAIELYYPTTNMGAEEMLLVKLTDTAQADDVRRTIENRLSTQKKSFDGYGVDQTALLNASIIDVQGNYILYIVHPDAAAIAESFKKSL